MKITIRTKIVDRHTEKPAGNSLEEERWAVKSATKQK